MDWPILAHFNALNQYSRMYFAADIDEKAGIHSAQTGAKDETEI